MDVEGALLRLAAGDGSTPVGYTVVLATARGGWKAMAVKGDLASWDGAGRSSSGERVHYATGLTPSAALGALMELVRPERRRLVTDDRRFPILWEGNPEGRIRSVPWLLVAPHAQQLRLNHGGQSIERLAERGGLSVEELWWATHDLPFRDGGIVRDPGFLEGWLSGLTDLRVAVVRAEEAGPA